MTDLRKKIPCTINVLGTPYRVKFSGKADDKNLSGSAYCSHREYLIVIDDYSDSSSDWTRPLIKHAQCEALRHEIIHAYLFESGLGSDSVTTEAAWAVNEEMIDWFAIQSPKIFATYKELGIL